MKKVTKIIIGILAVLIIAVGVVTAALVGRGKKDKEPTETTEQTTTKEDSSAESTTEAATEEADEEVTMGSDLSYEGYNLVWEDNFDGEKLNRDDWNVELHEPGWVNEEWHMWIQRRTST